MDLPIFPLQSGNEIRKNIFQRKVYLLCASAPLSALWWVWFAMICLKWSDNDVGFGSAQRTVVGVGTMICLKWGDNDVGFGSAQPTMEGVGTMICLKWGDNDVRFGSAQRTAEGAVCNDLFKVKPH